MTDYPALAERMFGTHLMVDPAKAAILAQAYGPRIFGASSALVDLRAPGVERDRDASAPRASILGDELYHHLSERPGAGYSVIGGVAVVPVVGTLVRRGAWIGAKSGVTSYEGLSAMIRAAAANPDVRAIALEIDSFGGEAMGVFELAADIRAARDAKPVYAFVSHYALSAGYAIASQATEIIAPDTAKAGSIGVVMLHADFSKSLEKDGIAITMIHSGAHKVDGNPYEPLPEEVRSKMQEEGDRLWSRFAMEVEAGRGKRMTAAAALKTEAAVFLAPEAKARGLIDKVSELRPAFQELVEATQAPPRRDAPRQAQRALHVPLGALAGVSPDVDLEGLIVDDFNRPDQTLAHGGYPVRAPAQTGGTGPVAPPQGNGLPADVSAAHGSSGCINGASAPSPKETGMSQNQKTAPDAETPKAATPAATPSPDTDKVRADGEAAGTDRAAKILAKCEKAGLAMSFAQELIKSNCSLEQAYDKIIDEKAARAQDGGDIVNAVGAAVVGDVVDRTREGVTKALAHRAGLKDGERNEFSGMTLMELARTTLSARGLPIPRGGKMEVVAAAFVPSMAGGMSSTSDFGNILADVANKSMLKGFEEVPETFERFTSVGTMSDFKPHKKAGLDAFPSLAKVEEGAEFQYGSLGDHGEFAVLATYGRLFAVTRQAIINDDLDAMVRVPAKMGRAARRTVGDLVFAILTGNPTMSDGTALFHSTHGNLAGSGAVPSEATINAAITAMSRQKDRSAAAVALNIAPRFLLAAPEQRSAVLQALNSEYAPDDTDKAGTAKMSRAYNTVREAAEPIFDARLPTGGWFMAADPMIADTIEVGYLDGVNTPFLEQQAGWSVDGTEFKVRLDATATALAWEGLYKNPGA